MSSPLRIDRLTLRDYRAFPGPVDAHFDLAGGNLLVYGENGAGKSSLFHALADLFSLRRRYSLRERKNVFSREAESDCRVGVRFNDGSDAIWRFDTAGVEEHPGRVSGGDARVVRAAQRRACLDYRALLDTNYAQGDGSVNLFEITRDRLLAEFPVRVSGGGVQSIGQLWSYVENALPNRRTKAALERMGVACMSFNQGFNLALEALQPELCRLLPKLTNTDVVIDPFTFGGLTYQRDSRSVIGRDLELRVRYRNHALNAPQHFLNEARLSALGLAIYLAGRLASVPTGPSNDLKLLVLDDVLIGLDHENRRPVLDVLDEFFGDWQVVLLTHDLHWFEMAKERMEATVGGPPWRFAEIFEGRDPVRGIPLPTIRPANEQGSVEKELKRADECVSAHHLGEAANRARVAWEHQLRGFCERRGIPVKFSRESRKVDTEDLRLGIEQWATTKDPSGKLRAALTRTLTFRRSVLHYGSHNASPVQLTTPEVMAAIAAVRAFAAECAALR